MGLLNKIKKAVKNALGVNDNKKQKMPVPDATLGPAGDSGAAIKSDRNITDRRRSRAARGRESTIITAGSQIGQRTLLG